MTVYTDEVNIYNTDAIAQDIQEAHDAHKAYITEVSADNGIVVAAAGKGTVNGAITTATTGWHLADVLEFIKQGVSRFWIGLKKQTDSTPTVRIGKEYKSGATDNESRMELDYHSMQLVDKENNTYFYVSDLRDSNGQTTITEKFTCDGETSVFRFAVGAVNTSSVSVEVSDTTAGTYEKYTNRVVFSSPVPAEGSTVTVTYVTSDARLNALTFGNRYQYGGGVGARSISLGTNNEASGVGSYAEGDSNHATGNTSHAEGSGTYAHGDSSHTEGVNTVASGRCSHAQNNHTTAAYDDQTAIGHFNDNQPDNAFEIGNGTSDSARSNAFAVDWDGNTETAGHYYAEGLKVGHSWCYINSITDTSITAKETDKKVPVNSLDQAKPSGAFEYVSSSKSVKCNVAGWYMVSIQAGFDNTATMSDDLVGIGVARVHSGTTSNIAGPDYVRVRTNLDRALLMPTPVYFYEGDTFYPVVRNDSNARGVLHTMRFMVAPLIG